MQYLVGLLIAFWFSLASAAKDCHRNEVSGSSVVQGPVSINTSPLTPFQRPMVSEYNSTAWEYWYVDGVSEDGASGITIVFFRDPSLLMLGHGILRVSVDAVWADGEKFSTMLWAENSVVEECEKFTRGNWSGAGLDATFEIAKDNSEMNIFIKGDGVEGQYSISSFSRPKYVNGHNYPDEQGTVSFVPLLSWNEPIPAGHVKTNVKLGSDQHQLSFEGIGGEDRNWAPFIWDYLAGQWWWMRSVTGPYTLVLWKFVSGIDDETYISTYLEKDGAPVFRSFTKEEEKCTEDCAVLTLLYDGKVHGNNRDKNTGFRIDLSSENTGEAWAFSIDHVNIVFEVGTLTNNEYTRFVNTARGGAVGEKEYKGISKSEQNRIVVTKPILPI